MGEILCAGCRESKPTTEYYRNKWMKTGFGRYCKACFNSLSKKYRTTTSAEQYKARAAVNNAIQAGSLTRQPCEVCGNGRAQAHHDDYTKPLSVRWLCRRHHVEWHKSNTPIYGEKHVN